MICWFNFLISCICSIFNSFALSMRWWSLSRFSFSISVSSGVLWKLARVSNSSFLSWAALRAASRASSLSLRAAKSYYWLSDAFKSHYFNIINQHQTVLFGAESHLESWVVHQAKRNYLHHKALFCFNFGKKMKKSVCYSVIRFSCLYEWCLFHHWLVF